MPPFFAKNKDIRRNKHWLAWNGFFAELRLFYPVEVLAFQAATGSFAKAMSVFAVASLTSALLDIPTGLLSDRWKRRPTLLGGAAAECGSLLLYFSSFSTDHPFACLVLGGFLMGTATALFSGNNNAMLYESLPPTDDKTQDFARILGKTRALTQIALAGASVLGSLCLWAGFSYQALMGFSLFPVGLSLFCAWQTVEPPVRPAPCNSHWAHTRDAFTTLIHNPKLLGLAIATMLKNGLGLAGHLLTPGFIQTVWPLALTSLFRAVQNGVGALSFWFAGRLTQKYGALRVLLTSSLGATVLSLTAYLSSFVGSPFLLLFSQTSFALTETADTTLQQENFTDAQRATLGSFISFGRTLVQATASVGIGFLADKTGPALALALLVLAAAPVNLIYVFLYRKHGA